MGQVSDFIRDFIRNHLQKHGIVIWYDPDKHYGHLVEEGWEDTRVLRYEGSYLRLRYEADAALEAGSTSEHLGETFPPVLIYLPLAPHEADHALVELEAAGVCLAPGLSPDPRSDLPRDTDLAALARLALRDHLPATVVEQVVADVQAGKLNLADLDNLVRPPDIPVGLSTFYQDQTPEEIALAFLTREDQDERLRQKRLLPDLEPFFRDHFGLAHIPRGDAHRMRMFVITHLLVTEAAVVSGTVDEPMWHGLPVIQTASARGLAVKTIEYWRRDRNLSGLYCEWAERVAQEINLPLGKLPTEALSHVETFAEADHLLLERLAETLVEDPNNAATRTSVRHLAEQRRNGFWPQQAPPLRQRWEALLAAITVLDIAAEVNAILSKGRAWKVGELVEQYAHRERGWYRLDRAYRRFEVTREALLDLAPTPAFTRLTNVVRRLYRDAVHRMAERLLAAWEKRGAEDVPLQREVFHRDVWPLIQDRHRVVYILVDALRYELVTELLDRPETDSSFAPEADLRPVLGTLPGITVLGMASLLPAAESSLGLKEEKGALVAEVDGHPLRSQEDRVRFLQERLQALPRRFAHRSLEEIQRLSDRDLEQLREVDVLLVTSQEIDQAAENMGPGDAQEHFRRVLRHLWRAVQRLSNASFEHVIITADHGFLIFGDPPEDGVKVDPPTGDTFKVGRRYWVGRGGRHSRHYAYFTAADLGLTGGLEFAFPRGGAVFRAAGGHAHYYHGGISLQELVVPLLHLRLRSPDEHLAGDVVWSLEPACKKVTSRVLRVVIRAQAQGLFRPPRRVRLEARADRGPVASQMVVDGCEYQEMLDVITIRPPEPGAEYPSCQVTLVLQEVPPKGTLELTLTDADTGARLAGPVALPIDIAIR